MKSLSKRYALIWLTMLVFSLCSGRSRAAELALHSEKAGEIGLSLINRTAVEAGQFCLTYHAANGFSLNDVTLTPRTEGYVVNVDWRDSVHPGEIEILILLYSVRGAVIAPGSGDILTLHVAALSEHVGLKSVMLTEYMLADSAARSIPVYYSNESFENALKTASSANPSIVPEPSMLACWSIGLCLIAALAKSAKPSVTTPPKPRIHPRDTERAEKT